MKMSLAAAGAASRGNFCDVTLIISPTSAMAAIAAPPTTATVSNLGGYDFAADPSLDWRSANLFWRPEVAADVVSFVLSPENFSGGPTIADLRRLAEVERCAKDGLHILWRDGTQLWVMGDVQGEQRLVALLPFDGTTGRRTIAATHARNRLAGIRAAAAVRMTPQTINRYTLRLRALDGLRSGASRREIAVGLFGADRVPGGRAWKSSDLRSMTYRLVDDALALSHGGYINLLQ